jgi:uncharacterized protein (UPF0332 family)
VTSEALIGTARRLAVLNKTRPKQSDLKRAISTAYYAVFHAIAKEAADLLVGAGSNRATPTWTYVYRALDHGTAKKACLNARDRKFSPTLCQCAEAFVHLQLARHAADYDPAHRVTRADATAAISLAEQAIGHLTSTNRRERTDFVIQLLLKSRAD